MKTEHHARPVPYASEGPWNNEPDKALWDHAGYDCLMHRHSTSGHWCGYVGVPSDHALYEKNYEDPAFLNFTEEITYVDFCRDHICHHGDDFKHAKVWWIGFDFAHGCDYSPGIGALGSPNNYKTFEYVKRATEAMAEQLAAV